jgi:hypothetical protein
MFLMVLVVVLMASWGVVVGLKRISRHLPSRLPEPDHQRRRGRLVSNQLPDALPYFDWQ